MNVFFDRRLEIQTIVKEVILIVILIRMDNNFLDLKTNETIQEDIANLEKLTQSYLLLKKRISGTHELIKQYNDKLKECERLKQELDGLNKEVKKITCNYNSTLAKVIKLELQNTEYKKNIEILTTQVNEHNIKAAADKQHIQQLICKIKDVEGNQNDKIMQYDLEKSSLQVKVKELEQELKSVKKSYDTKLKKIEKKVPIECENKVKLKDAAVNTILTKDMVMQKPEVTNKSVLTDEFYNVKNNMYPVFCGKCEVLLEPPPIDKICKVMRNSCPKLIERISSPLKRPQQPSSALQMSMGINNEQCKTERLPTLSSTPAHHLQNQSNRVDFIPTNLLHPHTIPLNPANYYNNNNAFTPALNQGTYYIGPTAHNPLSMINLSTANQNSHCENMAASSLLNISSLQKKIDTLENKMKKLNKKKSDQNNSCQHYHQNPPYMYDVNRAMQFNFIELWQKMTDFYENKKRKDTEVNKPVKKRKLSRLKRKRLQNSHFGSWKVESIVTKVEEKPVRKRPKKCKYRFSPLFNKSNSSLSSIGDVKKLESDSEADSSIDMPNDSSNDKANTTLDSESLSHIESDSTSILNINNMESDSTSITNTNNMESDSTCTLNINNMESDSISTSNINDMAMNEIEDVKIIQNSVEYSKSIEGETDSGILSDSIEFDKLMRLKPDTDANSELTKQTNTTEIKFTNVNSELRKQINATEIKSTDANSELTKQINAAEIKSTDANSELTKQINTTEIKSIDANSELTKQTNATEIKSSKQSESCSGEPNIDTNKSSMKTTVVSSNTLNTLPKSDEYIEESIMLDMSSESDECIEEINTSDILSESNESIGNTLDTSWTSDESIEETKSDILKSDECIEEINKSDILKPDERIEETNKSDILMPDESIEEAKKSDILKPDERIEESNKLDILLMPDECVKETNSLDILPKPEDQKSDELVTETNSLNIISKLNESIEQINSLNIIPKPEDEKSDELVTETNSLNISKSYGHMKKMNSSNILLKSVECVKTSNSLNMILKLNESFEKTNLLDIIPKPEDEKSDELVTEINNLNILKSNEHMKEMNSSNILSKSNERIKETIPLNTLSKSDDHRKKINSSDTLSKSDERINEIQRTHMLESSQCSGSMAQIKTNIPTTPNSTRRKQINDLFGVKKLDNRQDLMKKLKNLKKSGIITNTCQITSEHQETQNYEHCNSNVSEEQKTVDSNVIVVKEDDYIPKKKPRIAHVPKSTVAEQKRSDNILQIKKRLVNNIEDTTVIKNTQKKCIDLNKSKVHSNEVHTIHSIKVEEPLSKLSSTYSSINQNIIEDTIHRMLIPNIKNSLSDLENKNSFETNKNNYSQFNIKSNISSLEETIKTKTGSNKNSKHLKRKHTNNCLDVREISNTDKSSTQGVLHSNNRSSINALETNNVNEMNLNIERISNIVCKEERDSTANYNGKLHYPIIKLQQFINETRSINRRNKNQCGKLLHVRLVVDKFVNGQLQRLIDSDWESSVHWDVIEKLQSTCSANIIAKGIINFLSLELDHNKVLDHTYTPPAPLMAKALQRISALLIDLEKSKPMIIQIVQTGIEYKLFRLNQAIERSTVESLSRMYTVLARIKKDREKVRIFCCDALYCLGLNAVIILYTVLTCWPEVFPKNDSNPELLPRCMAHLILEQQGIDFPKLNALKNLIAAYYKYPTGTLSTDILKELLTEIQKDSDSNVETAIILLAKREGTEWSYKNVVKGALLSMIVNNKLPNTYRAFSLLGNLMRVFPTEDKDNSVGEIVEQLSDLSKSGEGSDEQREGVISALLSLTRHKFNKVIPNLLNWTPSVSLHDRTIEQIRGLLNIRDLIFWQNYLKKRKYLWDT